MAGNNDILMCFSHEELIAKDGVYADMWKQQQTKQETDDSTSVTSEKLASWWEWTLNWSLADDWLQKENDRLLFQTEQMVMETQISHADMNGWCL